MFQRRLNSRHLLNSITSERVEMSQIQLREFVCYEMKYEIILTHLHIILRESQAQSHYKHKVESSRR